MARNLNANSAGSRNRASAYADKRSKNSQIGFKKSKTDYGFLQKNINLSNSISSIKLKTSFGKFESYSVSKTLLYFGIALIGFLTIVSPVKTFFGQTGDLAQAENKNQSLKKEILEAKKVKQRLSNPKYYEVEARKKQQLVMPDENPYLLLEDGFKESRRKIAEKEKQKNNEWYTELWNSISE